MPNKPCPWCRGTNIVPMEGYVKCCTCKAEGPYGNVVDGDYESGLEKWNKRVDERELLAWLKECQTRMYFGGLPTVQLDRAIEEFEKVMGGEE